MECRGRSYRVEFQSPTAVLSIAVMPANGWILPEVETVVARELEDQTEQRHRRTVRRIHKVFRHNMSDTSMVGDSSTLCQTTAPNRSPTGSVDHNIAGRNLQ